MDTNDIPAELLACMREAAIKAMSSDRDREAMKKACERMDRMREEIQKKHGILDIGVPAIRELRDE
jgi:CHASE3 domain sensor protein